MAASTSTSISPRAGSTISSRAAAWLALPLRGVLFLLTQAAVALGFAAAGAAAPWQSAVDWWPVWLIAANLVTFLIIHALMAREGGRFSDLWGIQRNRIGKDLLQALVLMVIGLPIGGLGFVGAALLFYGGATPDYLAPLPLWARIASLVVMPVSIALVELPTYLGYSLERLERQSGKRWLPLLVMAFFIAIQHSALPFQWDGRFLLYRFVSMIPMALFVGAAYLRTRRMLPLMVLHYLLDLQLGVLVFLML